MRKLKPNELTHESRWGETRVVTAASAASPTEAIDAFDGALAGINRDKILIAKIEPLIKLAEQNDHDPHSRKAVRALRNLQRVLRALDKFVATHQSK